MIPGRTISTRCASWGTAIYTLTSTRSARPMLLVVAGLMIAASFACDGSKSTSSNSASPSRAAQTTKPAADAAENIAAPVDASTTARTPDAGAPATKLVRYNDPTCASATRSPGSNARATLELWNAFDGRMRVDWINFKGGFRDSGEIPPLGAWTTGSFEGHVFRVVPPNRKAFKVCASRARPVLLIAADGSVRVATKAEASRALVSVRDARYTRHAVGATPLWVHKRLPNAARQVAVVKQRLAETARLLGRQFKLVASVPLWLEPTYPHKGGDARYHPRAVKPTREPTSPKTDAVEVVNVQRFLRDSGGGMPLGITHEYVHAVHYHSPTTLRAEIHRLYQAAVKGGRYNSVRHGSRGGLKAYALSTEFEYFAEISEAYLGTNDWFPFWREQLAKHDPAGFALAERVWGKTAYRATLTAEPCTSAAHSKPGGAFTSILWTNSSTALVSVGRVHANGMRSLWRSLAPGSSTLMETTRGDVASVYRNGKCLGLYTATRAPSSVVLK